MLPDITAAGILSRGTNQVSGGAGVGKAVQQPTRYCPYRAKHR